MLLNSLPTGLRQTDIGYEQFRRLRLVCLGTEMQAHRDYLFELCLLKFSYLLTYAYLLA